MFTVFRAILIVLTFLKYGVTSGFARLFSSVAAVKAVMVIVMGVIFPVVMSYVMLLVFGYVVEYVLNYLHSNIGVGAIPASVQLVGISAYMFNKLGLGQALSIVTTASLIRFGLSMSVFRR